MSEPSKSPKRPDESALLKALGISLGLVLVLCALAFWPAPKWSPPARPHLQAPIVLDVLVNQLPTPAQQNGPAGDPR
jgi:hypothetical protein